MTIKAIKRFIVSLTPPVITDWYRRRSIRNRKFGFMKEYKTWQEARAHATGYDSDIITEKVFKAALQVRNGTAVYERDSTILTHIKHSWHLLASLLWVASRNENRLNLLDFGGSLGTSYFQNRSFLGHLKELRWNIVEQKKFFDYGKEYFEDEHLKFYPNIAEYARGNKPDAVLLSSSLQYIEKPYAVLEEIMRLQPKYVIFDKIPFLASSNEDHMVVQKVSPSIYDASYPCWVFGIDKFMSFFRKQNYRLVEQINHDQREWFTVRGKIVDWSGYLFEKI